MADGGWETNGDMGTVDPRRQDHLDPADPSTAPDGLPPALAFLVGDTVDHIRLGLQAAYELNGLTRAEVVAVERAVMRLVKSGSVPSLDHFWRTTALPRSESLGREARTVIDGALDRLVARAAPFGMTLATVDATASDGSAVLTPGPGAAEIRRRLEASLPMDDDLQLLGRWWLRRLRRSARLQAIPHLVRDSSATVGRSHRFDPELHLLDRPPWCHGDRLLAAFELVNAEIRRYGRLRIAETTEALVDPARHRLGALPA